MINTEQPQSTESTSKKSGEINNAKAEDETVKKLNNVEQSIKEKQIKTTNENIKGNIESSNPGKSKVVEDKPITSSSRSNENLNQLDEQESTSEQVFVLFYKRFVFGRSKVIRLSPPQSFPGF
jgi:hypothetical protein